MGFERLSFFLTPSFFFCSQAFVFLIFGALRQHPFPASGGIGRDIASKPYINKLAGQTRLREASLGQTLSSTKTVFGTHTRW